RGRVRGRLGRGLSGPRPGDAGQRGVDAHGGRRAVIHLHRDGHRHDARRSRLNYCLTVTLQAPPPGTSTVSRAVASSHVVVAAHVDADRGAPSTYSGQDTSITTPADVAGARISSDSAGRLEVRA